MRDRSREELVFWARRWREARRLCRAIGHESRFDLMVRINYATMLTEMFSWMFEKGKVKP